MTSVAAFYHDGRSSAQREVSIAVGAPETLRITGDGIDLTYPLADIRVSARVGNTRRNLYLPDGAQCECADNDAIDRLFAARTTAFASLLHRWENRFGYALVALALTLLAGWAGVTYGVPALAKHVAFSLPASTEKALGENSLEVLDRFLFAPSALSVERRQALSGIFAGMTAELKRDQAYRLEFRTGGKIGANAFALPSGIIIVTDELVQLAQNDDELVAVLAHELGHLINRHALRRALQDSATALTVAAVTGDITSITALAAAAPTMLMQAKFSRDFEREADDFALAYLARHRIAPENFSALLMRMEKQKKTTGDGASYLSSHPATRERVERSQAGK